MNDFTPKIFDSNGDEIYIKEDHVLLIGKDCSAQIPIKNFSVKLVFKPATRKIDPNEPKLGWITRIKNE
jgi:hypothetical protein